MDASGRIDQLPTLLAAGLDIRLNCIVKSVVHSATPVKVVTSQGDFFAEHVLVTVPLGVLKKGAITFAPLLPLAKRTAISRIGVGAFNKVILQFPKRFWPNGNWFLNIAGADPFGISFSSLEAAAPGTNLLVGWQYGQLALRREAMTDAALINVVMSELRAMFKSTTISDPIATGITRWTADPFSRGAYSYPRTGSPRTDITALAAPVASDSSLPVKPPAWISPAPCMAPTSPAHER